MVQDLTQKLINSWDWLNSFCVSKRGDCALACGKHAVCIVQIDDFEKKRKIWGMERTAVLLSALEEIMTNYAMDDNLIARYNDSTFVVILHFMNSFDEIETNCEEIKEAINDAELGWEAPLTVSIGASICRHDQNAGYQCAMGAALEALAKAHEKKDAIRISDAIK